MVTKNCDFVETKCSGYIAVSHALRVLVVAFRGSECTRQLIDELLDSVTTQSQDFFSGKVQAYFKTASEDLWHFHVAKSESSSFKESLVSGLGYRAFSWCCLSVLSECIACLLQHRSTSKHHLIHVWEPTSWRLQIRSATRWISQQQLEGCKFWRHSASSASLDPTDHKIRSLSPRCGGVLQRKGHQCTFCTQGMLWNTARRGQILQPQQTAFLRFTRIHYAT